MMRSLVPRTLSLVGRFSIRRPARTFANTKSTDDLPDNFFDENKEREQEILDMTTSVLSFRKGHTKIPLVKDTLKWDELLTVLNSKDENEWTDEERRKFKAMVPHYEEMSKEYDSEVLDINDAETDASVLMDKTFDHLTNADYADHVSNLDQVPFAPPEFLNYNINWRKTKAFPDENLVSFFKPTDDEYRSSFAEDERHCPGKRQRGGKNGVLKCHKIDLDALNYLDVLTLTRYITDDAEILGRKESGLCAKCQRKVARTIRRARNFGVLPHIGEYHIRDGRPLHREVRYHDVLPNEIRFVSKTILKV